MSIWAAILEFQSDPPVLTKNKTGHQSKYADLVQVNEVILPRLNKLGITWTTRPTMTEDDKFRLEYELRHVASGETIVGSYPLKLSENPQQMGSAITYGRRYALLAVLDIAAEDEDDDGHAASGRQSAQRAAPRPRPAPAREAEEAGPTAQRAAQRPRAVRPPLPGEDDTRMTAAQRAKLMALFSGRGMDRDERLKYASDFLGRTLASANDMSRAEVASLIDSMTDGEDDWPPTSEPGGED